MKNFVLSGNGSYQNRGCEAIVRGTLNIIEDAFPNSNYSILSHYFNSEDFKKQILMDSNLPAVKHYTSHLLANKSLEWLFYTGLDKVLPGIKSRRIHRDIIDGLSSASALIAIGGDNYSLDYGIPKLFTDFDNVAKKMDVPTVIWGASVGPFTDNPSFERYMASHLKKIDIIFARETKSVAYLDSIGIRDNVKLIADPAFMMSPKKPLDDETLKLDNTIGLNFSPLMSKYITTGNDEQWENVVVNYLEHIASKFDHNILLISHVTNAHTNDYTFMKKVFDKLTEKAKVQVNLLEPIYDAEELKWIISNLLVFAGARTHSTIASISTNVPTTSFAYSMKAKGINLDVFGSDYTKFCIEPHEMTAGRISESIKYMLDNRNAIIDDLKEINIQNRKLAAMAGTYLSQIVK